MVTQDYTVEFYEQKKHCISFHIRGSGTYLEAHEYGLGKLADINEEIVGDQEKPITYDEVRIIKGIV